MSSDAITVEGVGKRYAIGRAQQAGRIFRESLIAMMGAPFRRLRGGWAATRPPRKPPTSGR